MAWLFRDSFLSVAVQGNCPATPNLFSHETPCQDGAIPERERVSRAAWSIMMWASDALIATRATLSSKHERAHLSRHTRYSSVSRCPHRRLCRHARYASDRAARVSCGMGEIRSRPTRRRASARWLDTHGAAATTHTSLTRSPLCSHLLSSQHTSTVPPHPCHTPRLFATRHARPPLTRATGRPR